MRVRTYPLLVDKIDEGIRGGLNKAMKRDYLRTVDTDAQFESAVDEIHQYIMNAICEYFDWDDESGKEVG